MFVAWVTDSHLIDSYAFLRAVLKRLTAEKIMNRVFICSDLHLGHSKIMDFSPGRLGLPAGASVEDHNFQIFDHWSRRVKKRDTVYILGDVSFGYPISDLKKLPGQKHLIHGNHDQAVNADNVSEYLSVFSTIRGLHKYRGYWLSHAPVHPQELRGRRNIHGHVHAATLYDDRYINVCPENAHNMGGSFLVEFDFITHKYPARIDQ